MSIFPHKEFELVADKTREEVENLLKADIIGYRKGENNIYTSDVNFKGKIECSEFYLTPRRIRFNAALSKPVAKGMIFEDADNTVLQGTVEMSILSKIFISFIILCAVLLLIVAFQFGQIMVYGLIVPAITILISMVQIHVDFRKYSDWMLDTLKLTIWAQERNDY